MPSGEIEGFVEKKLGKFANMIYAILEWVVIILLFIDGILSFISYELAKFFELRIPCLICTKINRILVRKKSNFCYNNSLCEVHKKDISALAYCHVHKKLSDLGSMCEGCLLSFATEKGSSDCGKYKSLVGILHKDIDCFDSKNLTTLLKNKDNGGQVDENGTVLTKCSCCGELLKTRTSSTCSRSLSMDAPTPSPRAPLLANRNEGVHNMELPHIKYKELKFNSDNEPEVPEDENVSNGAGREDIRAATVPLLPDSEDINEGVIRTPNSSRGYRFFGIPLSDSAQASPKWTRKLPDASALNGAEADSILYCLKRQVRLDRKSLMALYMELDEERSASAVGANNAMAMITRLQAEKAAVQMEALQYQRMMEEQAEYDQEALQVMKDMLLKREKDVKLLETYREKYGPIKKEDCEIYEVDEDYQEFNYHSFSSFSEKSDCGSSSGANQNEHERSYDRSLEYVGGNQDDFLLDFEGERSHLLALLTDLEKKIHASLDEGSDSSEVDNVKYAARGGNEKKGTPTREVSLIRDRLRVIELDSGFLKHAAMTLQRGGEGTRLLTEIAQYLRKLRIIDKIPSEEINA
ncbi:putative myosin-binding protein 6 [Abeliophyllum distichum]|uniref:Myosin-binding protein 6 n=1 Tax=Abeliophyllum distichum TaxID=126358 RepID=A0ABD1VQ63_9LAMI